MKQLNWYQIFGKSNIPDGRTVLPTDDIQIWLNCANIWDKTYTTLAEVLADTDTLSALINSENAVDYMVRSTTWATPQELVPHMTSNTTPSGVCSASSNISTYDPWKAFDGTNTNEYDCWHSDGTVPQWLCYAFTTPTCVSGVELTSRNLSNNGVMPATFKIQGSNDGVNWDDLGSYSWTHGLTGNYTDSYSISGTDSYLYVRLYGDSAVVSGAKINIGKIQYYSAAICENSVAMTDIGLNNYCANTLLADATWCEAICNSEYFESVLNVKVPVMTSNTTPSGECIAVSSEGGAYPYYSFDGDASSRWAPAATYARVDYESWVGYQFTSQVKVSKADVTFYSKSNNNLTKWKIQGSNDGLTWVDVSSNQSTQFVSNTTFTVSTAFVGAEYQYYRLCADTLYYGGQYYSGVPTLQFYGREDV